MTWTFCSVCTRKGPILDCWLCIGINKREMTQEEGDALMGQIQKAWESAHPEYWLDVPFEDGTTPRQRRNP